MNKILVLAKNRETHFIKRLTEEVKKREVSFVDPFVEKTNQGFSGNILCRTTSIYGSDHDLEFLRSQGTRIINPLKALETFRTKKTQYQFFSEAGVAHVPWLDLAQCDQASLRGFMSRFKSEKFLIKPHRGLGGWGVEVFTPEELLCWFSEASDLEFLAQPYLSEASEHRYFFIKNEWSVTLKRENSLGSMAANFRQNGLAKVVDTPDSLPEIIRKVTNLVPMDFGAMDILFTDHGSFVLEINMVPGIEQLEGVTGENVMQKLIKIF